MARTKQTARKTTSSKIPRKHFPLEVKKVARKTATLTLTGVKKPKMFRPGTIALREIRKYQRTVSHLVLEDPLLQCSFLLSHID